MDTAPTSPSSWLASNKLLLSIAFGYGLCISCTQFVGMASDYRGLMGNTAKLMGFAAALLVCLIINKKRNLAVLPPLPGAIALIGMLVVCLGRLAGESSFPAVHLGSFLAFFGSSAMTIQWLELCATLPSKQIVVAIASSTAISSLTAVGIDCLKGAFVIRELIALTTSAGSLALLMWVLRDPGLKATLNELLRTFPSKRDGVDYAHLIPWVILLVITFAILSHKVSSIAGSGFLHNISGIVIGCVFLALYRLFPNKFDLHLMYAVLLPVFIVSLASVGYMSNSESVFPVFVFSLGESAAHVLVFSLILMRSFQCRVSPIFICSFTMLLDWFVHSLSKFLGSSGFSWLDTDVVVFAVLVIDSVVIANLIMHELDRSTSIDNLPGIRRIPDVRLSKIADSHRLTSREKTIFLHMADGKTNAQISDELFISQGAVRSHASRVYEKMGIASRREFDALIEGVLREQDA